MLAAPHGILRAYNAGLLAIHRPGQSVPGGQGGDRPPSFIFRVGGGGFWPSLRGQKGPYTRSVFARADYIRLKND